MLKEEEKEIYQLKELLFTIREVAVSEFDDMVVWLANRKLSDFSIPKKRYEELC